MGHCLALLGGEPRVKVKKQMRLVLIGIAGSGKTTFSKQMQIIHNGGFEPSQAEAFKKILLNNVLSGMKLLAEIASDGITKDNRKKGRHLLTVDENEAEWNEDLISKIKAIWAEEAVQNAWHQRKATVLVQLDYLMANFDRFIAADFTPSNDDILRARQRSTGENTWNFEDKDHIWNLVDLGGQMSERVKWETTFETHIHAVLFFIAIDEYDILNPEIKTSESVTKLALSFSIFEEIMNSNTIRTKKPSRIVFLNKYDLFQEKIQDEKRFIEFKKYLSYEGEQLAEHCAKWIEEKLMEKVNLQDSPLHSHVVCALDTKVMERVTHDIKISIITSSLKDMGIF